MSVYVIFECSGCDAKTEPVITSRAFTQISPMHARREPWDIERVAPEGWMASDKYTACCYCPKCWKSIMDGER